MEIDFKILDEVLNPSQDCVHYSKNFPMNEYEYNACPGSMPASELLTGLINQLEPKIVIEIGSFLGYSAICMGKALKSKGYDFRIICIDPWLGGPYHYDWLKENVGKEQNKQSRVAKHLKHGYPTMYHQFIYNVIHDDLHHNIIPLPMTSKNASILLKEVIKSRINVQADMIYVDGSHEDIDAYFDCKNFWDLLKPGGIMFGDDWTWEGVRSGVTTFAEEKNLTIEVHPNNVHWFIKKK